MSVPDLTLEGLVHDLNNVFQTIAESAEMLEDDPKWEEMAHKLQRCAGHGHRIAHSILEQNRSSTELEPVLHNASQFCQDTLESASRAKMEFCSDVETGLRLKGDEAGWERVFVNLFLNSAQAGARKIRICAHGNQVVVSDDGPGISLELLPRIFEPRVSTKSIISGLGLNVVKSIVEQNGGSVSAENGQYGGAVFTLRL
jgi:two-component system, NtrC family, C4-dicarboxylate transport sensor histidine kinase DctB